MIAGKHKAWKTFPFCYMINEQPSCMSNAFGRFQSFEVIYAPVTCDLVKKRNANSVPLMPNANANANP